MISIKTLKFPDAPASQVVALKADGGICFNMPSIALPSHVHSDEIVWSLMHANASQDVTGSEVVMSGSIVAVSANRILVSHGGFLAQTTCTAPVARGAQVVSVLKLAPQETSLLKKQQVSKRQRV